MPKVLGETWYINAIIDLIFTYSDYNKMMFLGVNQVF
jgi:hypothetical protein